MFLQNTVGKTNKEVLMQDYIRENERVVSQWSWSINRGERLDRFECIYLFFYEYI